ncbi:hypothetical protein ACIGBL_31890 [Streptomyces sp. NPDC085614]|uniref:hypothetical protein n=1 Tax=Streptomyces sp. NPDC085614 TaxID=3365733 RepID=UPI0037D2D263
MERCDAHADHKTHCAGSVMMILRHDPLVGQVRIVEEVCQMCAPLIPHARVIARAPGPDRRSQPTPRLPYLSRRAGPDTVALVDPVVDEGSWEEALVILQARNCFIARSAIA